MEQNRSQVVLIPSKFVAHKTSNALDKYQRCYGSTSTKGHTCRKVQGAVNISYLVGLQLIIDSATHVYQNLLHTQLEPVTLHQGEHNKMKCVTSSRTSKSNFRRNRGKACTVLSSYTIQTNYTMSIETGAHFLMVASFALLMEYNLIHVLEHQLSVASLLSEQHQTILELQRQANLTIYTP